jgi:hypothetical protein
MTRRVVALLRLQHGVLEGRHKLPEDCDPSLSRQELQRGVAHSQGEKSSARPSLAVDIVAVDIAWYPILLPGSLAYIPTALEYRTHRHPPTFHVALLLHLAHNRPILHG